MAMLSQPASAATKPVRWIPGFLQPAPPAAKQITDPAQVAATASFPDGIKSRFRN